MAKGEWLHARFDYIDTCRATCKICAQEMDVRAGRAYRHWMNVHGDLQPPAGGALPAPSAGAVPAPTVAPQSASEGAQGNGGAPVCSPSPPPIPRKPRKPPAEEVTTEGSRSWAVKEIRAIAASKSATPEQKLKAFDLLKEYEDWGTKRLDDEKEAEASRAQWLRVFETVEDLRVHEASLLKDPAVQKRLIAILPRGL